ncbi:MAG: hypothetical protein GF317_16110 [Candidatus Lokiarchaeota archaeon]|nr:hypothetical protein [Candidatus Lokiarchaeota archaeon]MBD3201059.1 hypothetical protein [Candidatus Lokiarchaeota archaeon]
MDKEDLEEFIQTQIISSAQKLKGKFSPISDIVDKNLKIQEVEKIFIFSKNNKKFYLFKLANYEKTPKYRYYIAITLADVSSDLLVSIARSFAIKNEIKLIQYNLSPKMSRISLIALKEIKHVVSYDDIIQILASFKEIFQKKIDRFVGLIK